MQGCGWDEHREHVDTQDKCSRNETPKPHKENRNVAREIILQCRKIKGNLSEINTGKASKKKTFERLKGRSILGSAQSPRKSKEVRTSQRVCYV